MTGNEGNQPYKRIKVTVTKYYEPDLSPNGGYWEPGGEYARGHCLVKDIEGAAAYDYFNYRDGQFTVDEYLGFEGEDTDVTVEVVTCIGEGETYEEVSSFNVSKKVDEEMFDGYAGGYDERERDER